MLLLEVLVKLGAEQWVRPLKLNTLHQSIVVCILFVTYCTTNVKTRILVTFLED